MTADDELHQRMRKIFAPAFSDRAIQEEPLLNKHTDLLIKQLNTVCEAYMKVDMVIMFIFATFGFIADCVLRSMFKKDRTTW